MHSRLLQFFELVFAACDSSREKPSVLFQILAASNTSGTTYEYDDKIVFLTLRPARKSNSVKYLTTKTPVCKIEWLTTAGQRQFWPVFPAFWQHNNVIYSISHTVTLAILRRRVVIVLQAGQRKLEAGHLALGTGLLLQ